jgi:hypothetical protein
MASAWNLRQATCAAFRAAAIWTVPEARAQGMGRSLASFSASHVTHGRDARGWLHEEGSQLALNLCSRTSDGGSPEYPRHRGWDFRYLQTAGSLTLCHQILHAGGPPQQPGRPLAVGTAPRATRSLTRLPKAEFRLKPVAHHRATLPREPMPSVVPK